MMNLAWLARWHGCCAATARTVETRPTAGWRWPCSRSEAYDLILSDLRMPELDGPGLYRALEAHYPHLCQRFILLTGDTLSPEVLAFVAESGVPRLTKPFTAVAVRSAIQQAMRAR